MKCAICKFGRVSLGVKTIMLNRDALTVVIKETPSNVCGSCGEGYMDAEVRADIRHILDQAEQDGVELLVRKYLPVKVAAKTPGETNATVATAGRFAAIRK